jgi:hypothetical protein
MAFLELGRTDEAYNYFDLAYGIGKAPAFQERPKKHLDFYLTNNKKFPSSPVR